MKTMEKARQNLKIKGLCLPVSRLAARHRKLVLRSHLTRSLSKVKRELGPTEDFLRTGFTCCCRTITTPLRHLGVRRKRGGRRGEWGQKATMTRTWGGGGYNVGTSAPMSAQDCIFPALRTALSSSFGVVILKKETCEEKKPPPWSRGVL